MVIASQSVFRSYLRRWIGHPSANQICPEFIIFFREAHHKLRETEISMDKLGYQSANAIVSQIVDQLRAAGDNNHPEPPDDSQMAPIEQPIPQANVTQDMVALMDTMMQTMERMSAQLTNQNYPYNGDLNRENRHRGGHWRQN